MHISHSEITIFLLCCSIIGILEEIRHRHGAAFTTLLAGRKITFLLEPTLITAMFRNSKDLVFGQLRAEVQESAFATSREGSVHPAIEGEIYPNAFRHFDKNSLSSVTSVSSRYILRLLLSIEHPTRSHSISLWDLVFPTMYTTSKAIFGESFPDNTLSDFVNFDEGFTFLASRIPAVFLGQYDAARARLIKQLVQWTNADSDADVPQGSSQLIKETVNAMKHANFRPSDIGTHLLSLLWGTQGNTIWTAIWFLAFLLQNTIQLNRLRQHIEETLTRRFGGSIDTLLEADPSIFASDDLLLLESGFRETMRLSSSFILTRQVTKDITLYPRDGRPVDLVEGETIFVTPRNIHMSTDIYDKPQT